MKTLIFLGLIALISAGTSGCWWGWGHRDGGDHHGDYRHDDGHHDEGHRDEEHHDEGYR